MFVCCLLKYGNSEIIYFVLFLLLFFKNSKQFNNFSPDLLHEISNPVLYKISVCFDKEFNIIGCEKSGGGIYEKLSVSFSLFFKKNIWIEMIS